MLQSDYTKAEEMKYICNSVKLQTKSFTHPTWYWPDKWMLKGKKAYSWTLVKKYQVFSTYTRGFVLFIIKNQPQRKKKFTKKPLQTFFFFQHWSQVFWWRYFSKKTCILHRGKKEGVKFSSCAMLSSTSLCHTSGFWDKFRKSNLLQLRHSVILHLRQHYQPVMLHLQNHPVLTERSPYIYWVSMKCDLKRTRTKIPV